MDISLSMAKRIELWPVDRLVPYEKNSRTHSPEQVAKLAAIITEFGFTNPILVDSKDGIIAGHGRLMAAKRLRLEQVPVIVLDHLSDAQRKAYIIADNKIAEEAGWDHEILASELSDLQAEGFDLDLTGFSSDEVDELLDEQTGDYEVEEQANAGKLPQALQMEPPKEFALVMCEDNEEWERLKVALNLQPVRRGGYKEGSPFEQVGTQRVIRAADLFALLDGLEGDQ